MTFNTAEPRAYGQVYTLDIEGFAAAYPNAFVKIDTLKADGNVIPFDANKFYYGDIEGNGKYRVEMANIWGCGHNDGWNGLKDTPFHPGGGETTEETALAFNSTFEVTFTIVSLDTNLEFMAKQTAVGLEPEWAQPGNWGKENPGAIKVVKENFQYKLASTSDLSMNIDVDADCGGVGPAMNESLKAELPLFAVLVTVAMSRVIDACLRKEMSRRRLRSWFTPDFLVLVVVALLSEAFFPVCVFFIFRDVFPEKMLKSLSLYAKPTTQSLLSASLIWMLVMLRLSTRVVRYSSLQVRLLCIVRSMPRSGANDSLMLTVLMLYIVFGTGLPVEASVMTPSPFMYSWKVL